MGFIFSKPVNYIKTKVSDTTTAVTTKVRDTKTAVVTKVDNTKKGISKRVTNVKDGVKARCNAVVGTVKKGGQAVHNKYTDVKDGITGRYTRTRNTVHGTYRKIRDTKLTRWQKLKYGLLSFVSIITLIIVISISIDLYQGKQEAAQAKIDTVCELFEFLWSYLQYFGENLYKAGRIGGKFILKAASTGGSHLWEWTKVGSAHAWEGTKVGAEYAWAGASSTGVVLANGAVYFGENALHYSKVGAENFVEGSKVAADYGWHGVSVGSVKLYEGSKVFAENAAVWAKEGSIYAYETSKTVAVGLATGSVSLSQVIMDVSAFLADKAYWTGLAVAEYTKWFAIGTWNFLCNLSSFTGNWTVVIAQGLYDGSIWLSVFIWDFCTSFSVWLYRFSISLAELIATKSISSVRFLWSWTHYIATEGSKGLYVGFNKVGVRGFVALVKKLGEWSWILGEIMWKFVNDLVLYTGNFLYVLSVHVYNVLYIVIAFVMQIIGAVMAIIKLIIGGLVAIVTFVFGGIIWLLEEFSGAYMFALHKYNMYREFLFMGFLGLMAMYCMGVMRDRRLSSEEEVDGLESSDEEDERIGLPDEIDAGADLTSSPKTPQGATVVRTPSGRLKNLPPIYEERSKLPTYRAATSLSSESSDDLGLGSDHDIPDALNSSLDSDEMLSGDEKESRVQNVQTAAVQRRNVNVPSSPRHEAVQPVQSRPISPQSSIAPGAPKPTAPGSMTSVRPTSPGAPVGQVRPNVGAPGSPGTESILPLSPTAPKAQVTMVSSPTTSANVRLATQSKDAPSPAARPQPASNVAPQMQQARVQPEQKSPTQSTAPKPVGQKGPVEEVIMPELQPATTQRVPFTPANVPKPGTSPPQSKIEPKPSFLQAGKGGGDSQKPEVQKPQDNQPLKSPPAVAAKPKSALHEKLNQFDAEKSKQTAAPQKIWKQQGPSEMSTSPPKSKVPLSTSPKEGKLPEQPKPASPPSSGFMAPARRQAPRQAPKMSPVGSPAKQDAGLSKSPSKTSEVQKSPADSPPSSFGAKSQPKSVPTSQPTPPKLSSAPKAIPGSSPTSSSPGGVSPPSKTQASPPAAAAASTSPTSPSGKGSSIRMLQQRLSQGSADAKPGGVRVRVGDFSKSPKKS